VFKPMLKNITVKLLERWKASYMPACILSNKLAN
ncbi:MAG: hypothetical protein ACI8ZZ_001848, partial [Gammaproteobacteria bacterium]